MISRIREHWRALLAVLLFVLLIAACGQKGDLYLPDEDPAEEIQQEDHM